MRFGAHLPIAGIGGERRSAATLIACAEAADALGGEPAVAVRLSLDAAHFCKSMPYLMKRFAEEVFPHFSAAGERDS